MQTSLYLGVVAYICTALPTPSNVCRTNNTHQCWELLRLFARRFYERASVRITYEETKEIFQQNTPQRTSQKGLFSPLQSHHSRFHTRDENSSDGLIDRCEFKTRNSALLLVLNSHLDEY